jgi:hypothetical protein
VVLEAAARRVTGEAVARWDLLDAAKGSEPAPGTGQAATDGESRGDSGDSAGGDGQQWAAGDVAGADGGMAVASLAPGGGDAGRRAQSAMCRATTRAAAAAAARLAGTEQTRQEAAAGREGFE